MNPKTEITQNQPFHWIFFSALVLFFHCSLNAEAPNQFDGMEPNPGAPPPGAFPNPPGIPGSDLVEEEDFAEPGENFGFTPPPPPPGFDSPPSTSDNNVQPMIPPPGSQLGGRAAQPSFGARTSPPPPPIAPKSKTAASTKDNGKKAPRLSDYLELDPSVKSLEVKNFDLPDKEIKDVVTLISKWTGKNFILDSKVRGKITVLGPSQVTLQEAYQAFLTALEANGLTTVQSGKFIRIIESAEARRAPVETYAGEYAPKTDQFITRIFQLKYINADEVQREFRDLTTRQGKLFAYEPTNSIIITDTGSNIARIQGILDSIDVKGFETTLHVLRIKNTSAKSISDMLGEIYSDDKAGKGGAQRSFRRSALERTRGGGIISKLIPDEQTNSLVVLANASGFIQLKQLVSKLDVKTTDTGRIHVYYCEYAKAEDLASTLASLSGGGAGKTSSRKTAPTATGAAAGGGASGPVTAELDGGVKVSSDAATNSLVITANSGDFQTLKKVIKKLDIPRLQVFVETALLEVAIDKNTKFGMNWGLGAENRGFAGGFVGDPDTLKSFLTNSIPAEGASFPIIAGSSHTANALAGTSSVPITVFDFMAFVKFITANTESSVLSTPQIIAMDNEKAEFKVLDETPVQSTFTAGVGTGSLPGIAQGTIERQKTGIELKLTPHVNAASKSVRLEIEQKVDSIRANASVPAALANVQVATTSRVANTTVVVKDQDYVMLGGLISDKIDDATKKVPLLGDIPLIGWLFKSKEYKTTKTNLIILLRPKIISTSIASANLISDRLKTRRDFVDKYMGGEDLHEDATKTIQQDIERQQTGKAADPFDKYRNNEEDEDTSQDKSIEPEIVERKTKKKAPRKLLEAPAQKETRVEKKEETKPEIQMEEESSKNQPEAPPQSE